jgi:ribosomal protein L34E
MENLFSRLEMVKLPEKRKCEECGKLFAGAFTLRRHQNQYHTGKTEKLPEEKGFLCLECGKRYSTRWNLHVHQQRRHLDDTAGELVKAMKEKKSKF